MSKSVKEASKGPTIPKEPSPGAEDMAAHLADSPKVSNIKLTKHTLKGSHARLVLQALDGDEEAARKVLEGRGPSLDTFSSDVIRALHLSARTFPPLSVPQPARLLQKMKEVLEAHALLVDNMRRNEVRVEEANVEIARMDKELKELKTFYLTVGGDNKAIKTQLDKIQLSTASELGQHLRRIDALSHTIHQHERRLELSHAALAATPTLQRIEHMQQEMAQQLAQMQQENKRGRSISPMPSPSPVRSPRRSSSPEPIPRELSKEEQIEQLKQQLAEKDKVRTPRVPDLPKPPVYAGHPNDIVEDKLFVFENYLLGSNIPRALWPNYIMPLLADKALTAWTAVAMPAANAGEPLTWDLFRSTMLLGFAHPDRQHKARETLHKVSMQPTQNITDYVRYFNSLVQRAGDPAPSMADQIIFFHTGLLPYMKDKTATNPATGKFWTDLHALQDYAITLHTHSANKSATMVPASSRFFAPAKSSQPTTKRVHFAQANQSKKPRFNGGHKGAGPSGPPKAFERERAPEGSEEEARRQLAFKEKQAQAARKKYEALKAKKN